MLPVPFDARRILSIDATPSLRVVRHASRFFISSRSPVSGFDQGRAWSQTVRPGSRHRRGVGHGTIGNRGTVGRCAWDPIEIYNRAGQMD